MFHSQCFQYSVLRFDFLPLFPIDCSNPTPCPFVRSFKKSFHICKFEVFHPSSHILLILLFSYCIANAFVPISNSSDYCFLPFGKKQSMRKSCRLPARKSSTELLLHLLSLLIFFFLLISVTLMDCHVSLSPDSN